MAKTDLEKSIAGLSDVESGDYMTLRDGKNIFRVCPAWTSKGPHAGKFFLRGFLHYGFKAEGRGRAYPCLTMFDEKASCPTCAFVEVLNEEGSESATTMAQRMRRQSRYWINVVDRRDGAIKILGIRRKQMREIRAYLQDPDYGDITDAEEGRDVVIEKSGSGLGTRYEPVRVKPKTTELGVEDWEEKLHKLSKVVIQPITEQEMVKALKNSIGKLYVRAMGLKTEKPVVDEEDEEEEAPPKPKGKKKVVEEEEEEEDDEEE